MLIKVLKTWKYPFKEHYEQIQKKDKGEKC